MDPAPIHWAAGTVLVAVVFVVAVAIAWIVLPFAIIGTKPILRDLLAAVRENNRLMRELREKLEPPVKPLYVEPSARQASEPVSR